MLTKPTGFVITSLFAFSVLAQPPTSEPLDRVVHLTHAETDQQLAEIATDLSGCDPNRSATGDPNRVRFSER